MEKEAKALLLEGRNCLIIWKKKLWLIVAMAIIGLAVGNVLTIETGENKYIATTKVSSYSISSELLISYASLIPSLKYSELTAEMLNDGYITAERIREMVSVVTTKNVPVVRINVQSTDKELAVKIANALAKVTVNEINGQRGAGVAQILESATVTLYSNAGVKTIIFKVGCMLLAAFATVVILGIKAITSKKIVVVEDFTCNGELSVIGMIPLYEGGKLKSVDREAI